MNHWNRKFALGLAAAGLFAIVLPGCSCRKNDEAGAQNGTQVETPSAPVRAEIAQDFKHAGYAAYGLDFEGNLEYEVVHYGMEAEKGQSTFEYLGIQEGFPTFRVVRTGALAGFGTQTLSVRDDGVYVVSSSIPGFEGEALEIPADLEIGKTWESSIKIGDNTIDSTNKVDGMETITVPAGEFEAYRIISTSRLASPGRTAEVNMKAWLVPNVGYIRMRSETIPSDGDKQVIEMQLSRRIEAGSSGSGEETETGASGG